MAKGQAGAGHLVGEFRVALELVLRRQGAAMNGAASVHELPTADAGALAASRDYCRRITRRAAKNFYYGLKLLPEPKRSAMFALYAYMRLIDDIADDDDAHSVEQRV